MIRGTYVETRAQRGEAHQGRQCSHELSGHIWQRHLQYDRARAALVGCDRGTSRRGAVRERIVRNATRSRDLTLLNVERGIEARVHAQIDGLVVGGERVARKLPQQVVNDPDAEPGRIVAASLALSLGDTPELAAEALLHAESTVRAAALRGIELAASAPSARLQAGGRDRFRESQHIDSRATLLPLMAAKLTCGERMTPYDELPCDSYPIEWSAPERPALTSALHDGPRSPLRSDQCLELGRADKTNGLPLAQYQASA